MSENYIRNVIEAALLAAGRPLSVAELGQLFEEGVRPENEALRAAITELSASYEGRGIEVKETASGVRIQVRQDFAPEVSRLWPERPQRYSRALLETLALIAYRQPITRAEIESVRGVAVNPNILKTLMERNWVRVVGHRDVPGHPELLGTAREFLDYFGLKSLDDLPPLAELKAMGEMHMQLPLPGTAEGSGDEVPLVAVPVGDPDEPVESDAVHAAATAEADVVPMSAGRADPAAAAADDSAEASDAETLDDDIDDDEEADAAETSHDLRIEAAASDDDGADSDADADEREAAGLDATGLVAAPPARDD
jgi:segregation and condensation protein B